MNIQSRKGPWFVVNMKRRFKAKQPIKRGRKPTIVYQTMGQAVIEADRLAKLWPGVPYAIFECIGFLQEEKPKKEACAKEEAAAIS
jgi:hypothetical protein